MVVETEAAVPMVSDDDIVAVAQLFRKVLVEEMGLNSTLVQIPGTVEYEENRTKHFNLDMISCHPLLFVTPTATQEVSLVVRGYTQGLQRWKDREQREQQHRELLEQQQEQRDERRRDGQRPGQRLARAFHRTRLLRSQRIDQSPLVTRRARRKPCLR